jgi:hypothetical protein
MQRRYFGPTRWHLVPPVPAGYAAFRRWNVIIISALAILVLGVFIATIGSGLENDAATSTGNSSYSHTQKNLATHRAARPGG